MRPALILAAVLILGAAPAIVLGKPVSRRGVPAAIFTDPPADAAHPPRLEVLEIPSGDVEINSVAYLAGGAGPHPTVILMHGLPGNEKNFDLAQAIRRAGWNVVTFSYRGAWGTPGTFRFENCVADGSAVLAYLRDPAHATALQIDTRRMVMVGHSMGGWVAALTAAHDKDLAGVVLISAADMTARGATVASRDAIIKTIVESKNPLTTTPEGMADDLIHLSPRLAFNGELAADLTSKPLLVLTANDGFAPESEKLVTAIRANGGKQVTLRHEATDHAWSGKRIMLQIAVIDWLQHLR